MIKNFVYLDEYKMYSLSSQIFEGITEYVVSEISSGSEKAESQKGPVGSGRVLADILKTSERVSEKKYFHDYSYTLFEKHLLEINMVLDINESTVSAFDSEKNKFSFVKVSAQAVFNDINSINQTLKKFNEIGKALTYVTSFKEIEAVKEQLNKARGNIGDRNQKAKLQQQFKSLTDLNRLAKEKGLQQDQKFLDDLSMLLTYGFQDQLEIQLKVAEKLFSANLKREYLREPEDLLIKKYSRQTEKNFVLFGLITQSSRQKLEELDKKTDFSSIKEALMNMVASLTQIEATFTGRLANEIIIDPIAVYTEL